MKKKYILTVSGTKKAMKEFDINEMLGYLIDSYLESLDFNANEI